MASTDRTPDRSPPVPTADTHGADAHAAARDAARAADAAQRGDREVAPGSGSATGSGGPGLGGAETKGGNAAVGVGAGVVGGTLAGLQAGALGGAVLAGVGGVAGAALGAAAGAALAQEADPTRFTADVDEHYRALYHASPLADRAYDRVRPAYVFGHVAAGEPELAGLSFEQAEPALRAAWGDELQGRAGAWEQVRHYVLDAYGHARAEGAGERRLRGVVGSGGSAVDPVELDRAQHGLPSVPE